MPTIIKKLLSKFAGLRTRNKLIVSMIALITLFCGGLIGCAPAESEPTANPATVEVPAAVPTETAPATATEAQPPTSKPRPTATEAPIVQINVSSANVRSGPGTNYDPSGTAVEGQELLVLATNASGDWLNVRLSNGDLGWIAASVVTVATSLDDVAVAATIPAAPTLPAATNTPRPLPTNTPLPQPTNTLPPAPPPTEPPPTEPPPAVPGPVVIVGINKRDEYVDIQNQGTIAVDLAGWTLVSERGNQACGLGGTIGPGQVLRIWALAEDAAQGGFNCNFGSNIWNNSDPDPAVLYDNTGAEVSRW